MKVAVLSPYIEGIGGAQKMIERYCRHLKERGHEITIFTQRYDKKTAYPEFSNYTIEIIRGAKSKLLSPFAFLLKKYKYYDLVIANDWPTHFASMRNNNVVWVCYSPKRDFYDLKDYYNAESNFPQRVTLSLKRLCFKQIDKICAKRLKKIFAISKTVRERVKIYYHLDSRIFYPGLDVKDYEKGKYGDYFLSVARFVKPKRVESIIGAMEKTKSKARLVLVGDGPDKDKIMELAKKNKRIVFAGKAPDDKLINLYANCRGVVYVPIEEDWGLVPLEAGASGKPIIGSNEGGLRETIRNDKNGFLLNKVTPEEIAKKMDLLFNNKDLAKKMGQLGMKDAAKYDWKISLKKFEEDLKI